MKDTLKVFATVAVIILILVSSSVPCVSAQVRGSEEKIDLPSDRISIDAGNKNYAYLIASLIESREHINDVSSEFSIYESNTSDNFNKKLNEYQEKLKGYQKQVGEIAIGQIVPDPEGIALDELTYGVAGGVSDIKTMADLSSILLSISQDTVDLCKEAREGGTTQTRVAKAKSDISEGYNSMIIQTASDAILFNEIMTCPHGDDNSPFINTYKNIIREIDTLPPKLLIVHNCQWELGNRNTGETVKRFGTENKRFGPLSSDITMNSVITNVSKDALLVMTHPYKGEEWYTLKGENPPLIYFSLDPNYDLPAIYGFRMPISNIVTYPPGYRGAATYYTAGYRDHYRRKNYHAHDIYYPDDYYYLEDEWIKYHYEEYGFEVPEEYKVGEISATSQQLQSLQEIKSYASEIPDYSASDPYNYLDNLTDRWGIGAQILKEYPVSSNGKEAFEEYKSDVAYLSNLAFYSRLFVVKDGRLLTVKPNEPVIQSLINIGDFKDHVNYFEDRIKRNGQIAKEEYAKPFKTKATEWNTEIKELEDKSKLAESKLQEGKPGILGMIFGDESYDAATTKFNEAQRRIKETEKNIKEIAKSDEVQIEKVKSVEASLGTIEKDLNELDIYFKKSGESSALYNIARAYNRYIENRCKR